VIPPRPQSSAGHRVKESPPSEARSITPLYRAPSDGRRHAIDESQVLMNPMMAEMRFKGRVASEKERLEEMMQRKIAQKQGKLVADQVISSCFLRCIICTNLFASIL
jgi:hypothetical protein